MDVYGKSVHPCQHTGPTQMSLGTFLEWIHCHTHDSILIHGGELKMQIADMKSQRMMLSEKSRYQVGAQGRTLFV